MIAKPDFIIVGGGSAGCLLANRLSAAPHTKIALIEAGKPVHSLFVRMPAGFAYAIKSPNLNWSYRSEPEPSLNGRRLACPRGKGLGGSSLINALAFTRGLPADFDDWSSAAGLGWSFENCLPHYRSLERFSGGADEYRGGDGPLHVRRPALRNQLYQLFLKACSQAGYAISDDPNGTERLGFGPMDQTIKNGERDSAHTAFIEPIVQRPNLQVISSALVTRILLDGRRAVGIRFFKDGATIDLLTDGEVILSAGAVNSPKLLMLSGIGPSRELASLGIDVAVNSPEVGRNLQDHVDVTVRHKSKFPISDTFILTRPQKLLIGVRWCLTKGGPGATNHFEIGGYLANSSDTNRPDAHVVFTPMLVGYDGVPPIMEHGFQSTIMLLRPRSRGSISLSSPEPGVAPRIRYDALAVETDVLRLIASIHRLRVIFQQPAIAPFVENEFAPGEGKGDLHLERYVRQTAKSTDHVCGTCRMGTDQESVVDSNGRVRGVERLRVIDASIFPIIPSANINATVYMVAEKLAKEIRKSGACTYY